MILIDKQKQRNPLLDCCKGIGIVFVVMWHAHLLLPNILKVFIFNLFFFCLAGTMIKPEKLVTIKAVFKYIIKIIKRYAKPYFLYNLLFLLCYNLFVKYNVVTYDYRYVTSPHLLTCQEIMQKALFHLSILSRAELLSGGSWFLKSLFWGLLSYSIIMYVYNNILKIEILKNLKYTKILLFFIITVVAIFSLHYTNNRGIFFYFQTLICLFIGDLIRPYIKIFDINYYFLITSIILIVIGNYMKIRFFAVIIFCVATFVFMYEISKIINQLSNKTFEVFTFLGKNTIPILIFHFFAFKVVSFLYISLFAIPMKNLGDFPILIQAENSVIFKIIYMLFGIIIPITFVILINKIRSKILLKQKA